MHKRLEHSGHGHVVAAMFGRLMEWVGKSIPMLVGYQYHFHMSNKCLIGKCLNATHICLNAVDQFFINSLALDRHIQLSL